MKPSITSRAPTSMMAIDANETQPAQRLPVFMPGTHSAPEVGFPLPRGGVPLGETLHEQAVPEAAVADRERVAADLVEDRADDASAGEDHLRPLRLKPDDLPPGVGVELAV